MHKVAEKMLMQILQNLMKTPASVLFCFTVSLAANLDAQRADTIKIAGTSACATCRISLERLLEIRPPDSVPRWKAPYYFHKVSDGDYVIGESPNENGVMRFDKLGAFKSRFAVPASLANGASFTDIVVIGSGDSIGVIGNTLSFFNSVGRQIHQTPMPARIRPTRALEISDGNILVMGSSPLAESFGQPFHLIKSDGILSKSFGLSDHEAVKQGFWEGRKYLTRGLRGTLLAAPSNKYEIERWSLNGSSKTVIRREVNWFPNWKDWDARSSLPPPPRLMSVFEDRDGLVWTLILVSDTNWKPTMSMLAVDQSPLSVKMQESVYDSIIEVFDPITKKMVSSIRLPGVFISFLGDHLIAQTKEENTGVVSVVIHRIAVPYTRSAK